MSSSVFHYLNQKEKVMSREEEYKILKQAMKYFRDIGLTMQEKIIIEALAKPKYSMKENSIKVIKDLCREEEYKMVEKAINYFKNEGKTFEEVVEEEVI